MSQLPPAAIITSTKSLRAHVDSWVQEPLLALDTESNSLHAYREQVCLIQLSTRQADFIIDPLLIENLDPLGELLAEPGIETVFHAAEYDIMCLKRDFDFSFAGLFDTMLAARICGESKLGLASMLAEHFGVKANKKYQRANWGERPIPDAMLHYAQLDTHYLPALRDYWRERLVEISRWDEAAEVFAALKDIPPTEHRFNPDGYWRFNGVQKLAPYQLAILRELYLFREEMAEQRDYPPFKVMADNTLVELAISEPRHVSELRGIRGMSAGQVRRYGSDILKTIRRGAQETPPARPANPSRPSNEVVARYEALHTWRKERALRRGVESDVIISREAMWVLARRAPTSEEELARIHEVGPWKTEAYGKEILEVITRAKNGPNNGRSSRR